MVHKSDLEDEENEDSDQNDESMEVSDSEAAPKKTKSSKVVNPDDVYNFADYDNEGLPGAQVKHLKN